MTLIGSQLTLATVDEMPCVQFNDSQVLYSYPSSPYWDINTSNSMPDVTVSFWIYLPKTPEVNGRAHILCLGQGMPSISNRTTVQ